jgi:ribosomal protein S19
MSRSLKKGPFIDFKLEKRVMEMNDAGKKASHQNLVEKVSHLTGFCGPHHRRSQWQQVYPGICH